MFTGYDEGKQCPGCGQWTHPSYTHTCPPDEKPKKDFEGWYLQDDNELLINILDTLRDIKTLLEGLNEGNILAKQETSEAPRRYIDCDDDSSTVGDPDGEPVKSEL